MTLTEQAPLLADANTIKADLEWMTARWDELQTPAVFELRALKDGAQTQIAKFAPDWIEDAVSWAEDMNGLGFNIYVVRNPIRHDVSGSAKDADIIAAFFLWADCDDPASTENVRRFDGPKFAASIVTGDQPDKRVHIYWPLQECCTDLTAWRDMQTRIADHFSSDESVVNPSRIMRLAGTVTYPAKHKRERGYTRFLTTLRTSYNDPRSPVTLDQMGRVFKPVEAATKPASGALSIDTGPQSLDRERTRIQALSGQEWHNAVLKLVSSYVAKGLSDAEVYGLTDPLTLAGYTVDQTRAEVAEIIKWARTKEAEKGRTPTFEIDTDEPEQPKADHGLEWFDDIKPVLSDSYIIKGVIAQETMSVIYGPSNSGKTFFALDLTYHAAIGAEWRGRRTTQTAVLYLAAEGGRGVANRIAALREMTGVCDVPFALRRAGMDLLKSEADLQTIYDLAKQVRAKVPGAPLLIVIDTLSRVMAGGDENSAADMTALIRNIDALRAATSAHIMLVHHTGKDTARGARGHSSLRAATDTEIEVQTIEDEDGNQSRAAMVTKQRDYSGNDNFAFTLKNVELGTDQDGDAVTSCVVEAADSDEFKRAKMAKKGRGKNQKIIMEAFDQMVGEGMAKPNPGGVGFPESGQFWCVSMDELRRVATGKMTGSDTGRLFRQSWDALTGDNPLFCVADKLAWRIDRRIK